MLFQDYQTKETVHAEQFVEYLSAMENYSRPVSPHHFYAQSPASRANEQGVEYKQQKIAIAFISNESKEIEKKLEIPNMNVYSIKSEYAERAFAGFIRTESIELFKLLADKFQSWTGTGGSIVVEDLPVYGWRVVFRCENKKIALKLNSMCLKMIANLKTATFSYEQLFLRQSYELIKLDHLHGVRNLCDAYDLALTYHLKNHKFNGASGYSADSVNKNPETIHKFASPYQILHVLSTAREPEHIELLTAMYITDMGDLLCSIQHTLSAINGVPNFSQHYIESRIALA